MKRAFVFLVLMALAGSAQSQSKRQAVPPGRQESARKTVRPNRDTVFSLQSVGSYPAKISPGRASEGAFQISDPVIRLMDNAANFNLNTSGVVGMPKHAYGFANGHLSLKTSGATTSATQTGSGSVGTGTSLGTFGSAGPAMGVNGKSPYAGTVMWGTGYNMFMPVTDSLSQKHWPKQ